MIFLLVLCIIGGAIVVILPTEYMLYVGLSIALVCISIMVYVCYKKLQGIENKINEMNYTNNSEDNSKEK